MPANSFHAVVCDPPYGIRFMGKPWDHLDIEKVRDWEGLDDSTERTPSIAMAAGQYDLRPSANAAFQEFSRQWALECLRVLRPGGYLLCFSSTRTFHRMVCGVEDAGFEVRDTLAWVFGSGFPKSKNLGVCTCGGEDVHSTSCESLILSDWRGWGTALKPAYEPILVARKPLDGTVAQNVQRWGCGAVNIDGCRVGVDGGCPTATAGPSGGIFGDGLNGTFAPRVPGLGRWPANLIHDGSDEVFALFPSDAGAAAPVRGDAGSAARFFYCAKASRADRDDGLTDDAPTVQADPTRSSGQPSMNGGAGNPYNCGVQPRRNHHPTVKPTALMRWLVRLVARPGMLVLDPFYGSGSTGRACALEGVDFVGVDLDEDGTYGPVAEARIRACGALVLRA
jgi:site-specific DNA-methyltransferase (adenine-specific)